MYVSTRARGLPGLKLAHEKLNLCLIYSPTEGLVITDHHNCSPIKIIQHKTTQYYHCSAETNHPNTSHLTTAHNFQPNYQQPGEVLDCCRSVCKSVVPKKHEEKDQDLRDYSEWMQQYMAVLVLSPSIFTFNDNNCGMECN